MPPETQKSLIRITAPSKKYESTNFQVSDSPVEFNINGDLGRHALIGYFINDGLGDILYAIDPDGNGYGEDATLKQDESINFANQMEINKLRFTWVADSSYRINVA